MKIQMNSTNTNHPLLAKGKLTKLSHRCTALNITRCFKRDVSTQLNGVLSFLKNAKNFICWSTNERSTSLPSPYSSSEEVFIPQFSSHTSPSLCPQPPQRETRGSAAAAGLRPGPSPSRAALTHQRPPTRPSASLPPCSGPPPASPQPQQPPPVPPRKRRRGREERYTGPAG